MHPISPSYPLPRSIKYRNFIWSNDGLFMGRNAFAGNLLRFPDRKYLSGCGCRLNLRRGSHYPLYHNRRHFNSLDRINGNCPDQRTDPQCSPMGPPFDLFSLSGSSQRSSGSGTDLLKFYCQFSGTKLGGHAGRAKSHGGIDRSGTRTGKSLP